MSEWVRGSLGELASGVRGVSYTPSQLQRFMSPETVVLLRSNNIKGGQVNFDNVQLVPSHIVSNEQLSQHGDIAVCMSNGSKALVGKSGRIEGNEAPCTVGAFCSIFRPHAHADEKFVSYVFQSVAYRRHLDIILAGSAINNLRNSDVEELSLEIPPRQEQRLIAHILDTLDTQIQKTEALIAKLEKVKEGLLHDLLTRGIDENGQLRPSPGQAPELYKESPLGLIPREWSIASLGGVSEIVSGVTLGSKSGNSAWPLVPYLRVANVQDGYLDLSEIKLVRVNPDHIEKYRLHPGDVLMNEGGDFDKLGRGTLWRGEIELCVHQNHVFRVRTDGRVLDPYFLASFSASFVGKRYFVKSSKQSTNLASINSTQLKAFEVPLPSIEEQGVIVDKLQVMADRIEHEKSHLSKLAAHKSGLMDDLLTGRVRVTPLLEQAQAQGTTPA